MTDTQARDLEISSDTVAWSLGSRSFSFEAAVAVPLPIGASVLITSPQGKFLGQIVYKEPAGDPGHRRIAGSGTLLARLDGADLVAVDGDATFAGAALEPAPVDVVEAWYANLAGAKATLTLGTLRGTDQPAQLIAAGFNRHTFLCGQSGSGKTYTLGVILEQLLLNTTIPLVVLDPNSDYVHLDEITRPDGSRADVGRVVVFRADGSAPPAGPLRAAALAPAGHGARARPGRRHREPTTLCVERPRRSARPSTPCRTSGASWTSDRRHVGPRGSPAGSTTSASLTGASGPRRTTRHCSTSSPPDWRAAVADLGEIPSPEERSAIVALDPHRDSGRGGGLKQPVLIVIDEAHNVCPQAATDPNQALAIELTARIAAEGRKYGLFLLLATQSPRKLNANVLSQCENLLLMKTNSVADVGSHGGDLLSGAQRPDRSGDRLQPRRGTGSRSDLADAAAVPGWPQALSRGRRRPRHGVGATSDQLISRPPIRRSSACRAGAQGRRYGRVSEATGDLWRFGMTEDNEVASLRAEVEEPTPKLKESGQPPSGASSGGRRTGKWRIFVAALLIIVAAILAPGSVVAAWARDEVGDTDRYVATVAPLASDPAVQQAAINRITTEIFSYLNVNDVSQSAVKPCRTLACRPG